MITYLKNTFFIIGLLFLIQTEIYGMDLNTEASKRNWQNSLNIYNNSDHIFLDGDAWFHSTHDSITEPNAKKIVKKTGKKKVPYTPNIAKARFTIIYSYEDTISSHSFSIDEIFISGQLNFEKVPGIISAQSFQKKDEGMENNTYDDMRQKTIHSLFNVHLVTATCAEASILQYIHTEMSKFISFIKKHKEGPLVILGTILEVSSLKDPCSQNCMNMFTPYMEHMPILLNSSLSSISGVSLAPKLENLVLLAGRGPHINSRDGLVANNSLIKLNLENPSNRIFSKTND